MRENFAQSMAKQVEAQAHFRPSVLSLDTCILSYGRHMHPCFLMTSPWPPFSLDQFLSLVQVHLWSNVVRVFSSFWSLVMANFPICSHHAIGKEVGPPKNFSLVGIHLSRSEFGALGLVLIISPSSNLRIMHHFFLWTPYSSTNILSRFQNFSQPDRPVGIQFNWFIKSACMEH